MVRWEGEKQKGGGGVIVSNIPPSPHTQLEFSLGKSLSHKLIHKRLLMKKKSSRFQFHFKIIHFEIRWLVGCGDDYWEMKHN